MNRLCPMCGNRTEEARCPQDGTATLVLAQNPDSRLVEGTEVNGRYRVGAIIGQGGFGSVYRATSLATGQAIAIKVLAVSLDSDESELIQRFFAEAQITAGLKHPNTIRVFDFGQTEGGALYIAMELLSGQALNELLRERRKAGTALTQEETLNIASQTLRSLTEAHMMGLVHRDLKPHNIFLNDVPGDDPVVKVLDFGIAKRLGSNLTGTGQAFGTPTYMSPEQAQNRPIDARSDIYSLAVVLYQCIAGRCPFEGDNPLAVLLSHVTDTPADLFAQAAHPVSREFTAAIERALAKDPNDRFAGAVEMRKALEACASAPSQDVWERRALVVTGADNHAASEDDQTAAYRPVKAAGSDVTKAGKPLAEPPPPPTTSPRLSPMPPLSALSRGASSPGASSSAEAISEEGQEADGSGFTQAFMHRGAALEASVADALDADQDMDEAPLSKSNPTPKSNGAKLGIALLLLVLIGGGAWFVLRPSGGAQSAASHAEDGATAGAHGEAGAEAAHGGPESAGADVGAGAAAAVSGDVGAVQGGTMDAGAGAEQDSGPATAAATPDIGFPSPPDDDPSAAAEGVLIAAVRLETIPSGAQISIHGKDHGKTPHAVVVNRGENLRVTLSRPGYRDREVVLVMTDAPVRQVKLTKAAVKHRPRKPPPKPPHRKPPHRKVKSALEERL